MGPRFGQRFDVGRAKARSVVVRAAVHGHRVKQVSRVRAVSYDGARGVVASRGKVVRFTCPRHIQSAKHYASWHDAKRSRTVAAHKGRKIDVSPHLTGGHGSKKVSKHS